MIPPPGQHGGDGPAVARALGVDPATVLDLSASLNPAAPDITALARRHLGALRHYPDHRDATRAAAEAIGTAPGRFLLTNGGSEAIAIVAAEIGGRVRSEPEFALHPRGDQGPLWRSDPHNPTGRLADPGEQAGVWDEAFYPLATGRWSAHRDGVVVGSLTKIFACPGLRIGYVIADDIDRFTRRQPQWPLNSLAVALIPELLAAADLPAWTTEIATRRGELTDLLASHGLSAEPSDAPWVLTRAPGLRDQLAPHGVIVRDCASFGLAGHVRIAVPDSAGLARLDTALDRALATRCNGEPVTGPEDLRAIVFDIGDTLVHAAPAGTPIENLIPQPIGDTVNDLRALARRYRLAAVTDTSVMSSDQVRAALRGSDLDELLEIIVTSVDVGATKPDPRGLQRVLDTFAITPAQALFVGDADCDAAAAAAAGVAFVRAGAGRSPGPAIQSYLDAHRGETTATRPEP